jgi:CheY-like chemotaxis protein
MGEAPSGTFMGRHMIDSSPVLIAGDAIADVNLVRELLAEEYPNIMVSTDPDRASTDFTNHRPRVLVLAFKTLSKAEDHYLGLYRNTPLLQYCPHGTVVLCTKDDVPRAYELCTNGRFDDYVHFWPMSFDAPRLHMAIRRTLRELERKSAEERRAEELLVNSRAMSQLDSQVSKHVAGGLRRMEVADESLKSAEAGILSALDALSRKLAARGAGGSNGQQGSADISGEMERVKSDEVGARLSSVSGALQSVREWSTRINDDLAPQLSAAKAVQEIVDARPPHMLIVDDDVFQHRLIALMLAETHATMAFAASGAEALAALQKQVPTLILLDFNLPDMKGSDIVRQIKAVERYAGIPIVMLTAQSERSVVLECKSLGAVDFVVKPFTRDTLLAKVKKWLATTASGTAPVVDQGATVS